MPRMSKAELGRRKHIEKVNAKYAKGTISAQLRRNETETLKPISIFTLPDMLEEPYLDKYYKTDRKDVVKAMICGMVKSECLLIPCPHFYVGASHILDLISCKLTPSMTHQFMKNSKSSTFGIAAEIMFERKYGKQKSATYASRHLPFICGSPDFVMDNKVIEIKSSKKNITLTKESLLQILVYMEILDLNYGEVRFYRTKEIDESEYVVTPTEVVGIVKEGRLFYDEFNKHACKGYISYLALLLTAQKIHFDKSQLTHLMNCLIENSKEPKTVMREMPKMQVLKMCSFISHCEFKLQYKAPPPTGFRWNDCYSRCLAHLENLESMVTIPKNKMRYVSKCNLPENDIYCNAIPNNNEETTNASSFYETHTIEDETQHVDKSKIQVEECQDCFVVKRALKITSKDIEQLFTYFTDIREIGMAIHNFEFLK